MSQVDINIDTHFETIGALLKTTRKKLGLDLRSIARETKISCKNLRAIENDDFRSLPALAFARGMYSLYARALKLNQEQVLQRFANEHLQFIGNNVTRTPLFILNHKVGEFAGRPNGLHFTLFGLALLLLLAASALICWYLSWNPAIFLSQKLRSFDDSTVEARIAKIRKSSAETEDILGQSFTRTAELFSSPTQAIASVAPPAIFSPPPEPKYQLTAYFNAKTTITVAIDDRSEDTEMFVPGQSTTWLGNDHISLSIEARFMPRLTLNDVPYHLPKKSDKPVTITIPDTM
jgi:cytoskeletal protein RodZ